MAARDYTPRPKVGMPPKKPYKGIKRTAIKVKRKKEGMLSFMVENWNNRLPGQWYEVREYKDAQDWFDHTSKYRVCCVTYLPLQEFNVGSCMHVLTKHNTRFKTEHFNLVLGQYSVHQAQEFASHDKLEKLGPGGKWFWEYQQLLRERYNTK